ncbi:hypothetical protein ROZALSC1DRAFT_27205, partial [Rozella allomycis CSF55]
DISNLIRLIPDIQYCIDIPEFWTGRVTTCDDLKIISDIESKHPKVPLRVKKLFIDIGIDLRQQNFVKQFENVTELSLHSCPLTNIIAYFRNLKHLTLKFVDISGVDLLDWTDQLISLNLCGCIRLDDDILKFLINLSLESLHYLNDWSHISETLSLHRSMEKLTISGIDNLENAHILKILECESLRDLKILNCIEITTDDLDICQEKRRDVVIQGNALLRNHEFEAVSEYIKALCGLYVK